MGRVRTRGPRSGLTTVTIATDRRASWVPGPTPPTSPPPGQQKSRLCRPTREGLEIDVVTGRTLEATVLVDESVFLSDPAQGFGILTNLVLRLVPTRGQGVVDRFHMDPYDERLQADSGGRTDEGLSVFRWAGLWPGTYRLEVSPRGTSTTARSPTPSSIPRPSSSLTGPLGWCSRGTGPRTEAPCSSLQRDPWTSW